MIKKVISYVMLTIAIFNAVPVYAALDLVEFTSPQQKETKELVIEETEEKEEEATIEEEIVSKREENKKYFKMSDGTTLSTIYNEAVHYKENGKYADIDNRLNLTKDGKYVNSKNSYKVEYNKEKSKELLKIENKGYTLSMDLLEKEEINVELDVGASTRKIKENKDKLTIENIESGINYKKIKKNIDIKYETGPNKVKETIILNSKEVNNIIEFKLTIEEGLKAEVNKNNEIEFKNDKGELIYLIEAPFMYDKNLEYSNSIKQEIIENKGYYLLRITVDKTWLSSSERKYPVVIDPTIATRRENEAISDTIIYEGDSTNAPSNRKYAQFLRIGSNNLASLQKNPVRALIKFELPSITTGDQITQAKFNLTSYPQHSDGFIYPTGQIEFNVHKMTKDWTSDNAYWSNLYNGYDSSVSDYALYNYSTSNPRINYAFDITKVVKDWYLTGNNYGLVIKEANEVKNLGRSDAYFYSSDASSSYSSYKPVVIITYRNQTGLEGYQTYTSSSLGRSGNISVNNYNGNLVYVHNDIATPGGRLPVNIYHVYNSNDRWNTIGYGFGYRLNLSQTIEVYTNDSNYLIYIDEDGTRHYFYKEGNIYKDEDGLGLVIGLTGSNYYLEDRSGNKSTFTKNGTEWYLTEIKDTSGNNITINRNSSNYNFITSVVDASGATLTFTYSGEGLIGIKDINGYGVNYSYTAGNLTMMNYTDGENTLFKYGIGNILSKVTAIDNQYITIENYGIIPYRIKTITEYSSNATIGNKVTFAYGENTTKITDNNGNINNYSFNNWGETTSITDLGKNGTTVDSSYGISYKYENNTKSDKNNRLILESNLVKSTNNLLLNSGAEVNLTDWYTGQWKTNVGSITAESNNSMLGSKSFKISNATKDNIYPLLYQLAPMEKGKTYTLSAYIKGEIFEKLDNESGLVFFYEYKSTGGTWINAVKVIGEVTSNYDRYSYTFTMPNDVDVSQKVGISLKTAKGTIYIDNIQLEEGEVANPYNLINNGGFDKNMSGWTAYNTSTGDGIATDGTNKVTKMIGEATKYKSYEQAIDVNGKKGDSFNISFWAKNTGIATPPDQESRRARVVIYFYNGSTLAQSKGIYVDPDSNNWQYVSEYIVANQDYTKMTIYIRNDHNKGYVYYDNVSVYKDEEGTSYAYDDRGNVTSTKDLAKQNSTFNYDKADQLISTVSPKGRKFVYEYDYNVKNRLLRGFSESGVTHNFEYDSYGNNTSVKVEKKTTVTSINEAKSYYIKSISNNLYVGVNGDLNTNGANIELTKLEVTGKQEWNLKKLNSGNYSIYAARSTTNKVFDVSASSSNIALWGKYSTDNANQESQIVKNGDGTYTFKTKNSNYAKCVDAYSANLKLGDNIGEYNCNGTAAQKFILIEVGEESKYIEAKAEYSLDGRYQTKAIDQRGNSLIREYNVNTGTVSKIIDSKNNATTYSYDSRNRVLSTTRSNTTNSYSYTKDRLNTITHNGFNYTFNYDTFGNTSTIKIGTTTLITNEYENNNGNIKKSTYGNGSMINYTYDEFNRISAKTNDIGVTSYKYDARGNIAKITSPTMEQEYSYDLSGRITRQKDNRGYKTDYNYDSYNNISKKVYKLNNQAEEENYIFDVDNKITEVGNIKYTYDELERLATRKIGSNYITKYNYLNIDTKKTTSLMESIENGSNKLSYSYDSIGNIEIVKENNVEIAKYYYDILNQLVKEDNKKLNKTVEYVYDQYGNIVSKKNYNYKTTTIIDTISYEYSNTNWKNQLTSYNGKTITYDLIGNPLSYGSNISYTWQNGRQLVTYKDTTSNLNVSYKYNDEGIRTEKTVNGVTTKYYLEGNNIIFEDRGGNVIYYNYDASGISGFEYQGNTYYYVKNLQGDVIGILDSSYNQIVTYQYDSWGNPISMVDQNNQDISTNMNHIGNINSFRYRGYYWDNETKLYYLNSRYYNPEMGRFINADNLLIQDNSLIGNNLYAYVNNNPIRYSDKTGHWFGIDDAIAAGVGALIGVGGQFVSDVTVSIITWDLSFSNWETYSGALLGGGVGGVATLYSGPILGPAAGGAMSTMISQSLESISGTKKRLTSEIMSNSIVDGTLAGATSVFTLSVAGITSGKNNFQSVYNAGVTKISNNVASRMSGSVFAKGTVAGIVGGIPGSLVSGVKTILENLNNTKSSPKPNLYQCPLKR